MPGGSPDQYQTLFTKKRVGGVSCLLILSSCSMRIHTILYSTLRIQLYMRLFASELSSILMFLLPGFAIDNIPNIPDERESRDW